MNHAITLRLGIVAVLLTALGLRSASVDSEPVFFAGSPANIAQSPLYIKDAVPPLNLLVMGKDHKIYYEAYNDAGDLTGDGIPDVGYKPNQINYYGYFNSNVCYTYDSGNNRFNPSSYTANKQCSARWSGDFLNYLTMSRMDALRRVLYGGWRQVDTDAETVLQGAFFPQDAHSWGKEYQGQTRDGYNISDYAPLSAPDTGKYHLFAVTTVADNTAPLFRVMQNTESRVWNWLSIEGPVAGNRCFSSTNQRIDCIATGDAPFPGHPGSRAAFDSMETTYAIAANRYGSGTITQIDCNSSNCNPHGDDDNYLTIIEGQIEIRSGRDGNYQFRVDGDDVIDFTLSRTNGTQLATAGCYNAGGRGFGACGGAETSAAVALSASTFYNFRFRHEEGSGGDGYRLEWRKTSGSNQFGWRVITTTSGDADSNGDLVDATRLTTYDLTPRVMGSSRRDDYQVRVLTCPADATLREDSCKVYPNGRFKPTGILHEYGETQKMYFGLITGSQPNNLEGGVLRRNMANLANEITPTSGVFRSDVNGIVNSISRLRMVGGGYNGGTTNNLGSDSNWAWSGGTGNCPSVGNRSITNGECRMWGNPIAEMLYEGMRYFAGADRTPRFATGGASQGTTEEATLGLGQETWQDPYKATADGGLGFPTCAKPVQTIISDINPSYDGDIPGSAFSGALTSTGTSTPSTISGFNAATEAQAIWNAEYGGSRSVFIGEANGSTDGAPTAKTASSFGNIRGLSPEEPTKGGTYYSASVARYGYLNDVNPAGTAAEPQRITTYSIALASPLPKIELSNGISILPFAKTASGTFGDGGQANKPTNTIVDFYVQQYENFPGQAVNTSVNSGRPQAVFRINYEDVEQGNDHDMDAIVLYEIKGNADGTVQVKLTSEYAAGSADQNIGYVISGTNRDGIYLVVRDTDSGAGTFRPYNLNTPPGVGPGGCVGITTGSCNQQLPLESTRTFTATGASTAIKLRDPLWYAAKYGGTVSTTGQPDNYFLVTNPLQLRAQLSRAFDSISDQALQVGSASISGARVGNASFTLQPSYRVNRNSKDWTGELTAIGVERSGALASTPLWRASTNIDARTPASRNIRTIVDARPGTFLARDFQPANLSLSGLGFPATAAATIDMYGANYSLTQFVEYLRGDQANEAGGTGTLRARGSVLGDTVNSEPVIASPRSNFGFGNYTGALFSGYSGTGGYLSLKASRRTVAYFGANDGMLHAIDASTQPCSTDPASPNYGRTCARTGAGEELFAFVPNGVLNSMSELPKPDSRFTHRYFVDGQITVSDAKDPSASGSEAAKWKTLLVGSAGAGGRSVFALNVTNPDSFGDGQMLWERNATSDLDIGNVYGKPLLVPLENGEWGVLFGNGYGGNRSDPSLYILNAFNGQVIKKITADDGAPASTTFLGGLICGALDFLLPGFPGCARTTDPFNGLGQITSIDKDGDGKVDTVYGGDLQGHLWKFDISSSDTALWAVANGGRALFRTQSTTNDSGQQQYQPITGGIRIAAGPGTGAMVYFGTGRYFVVGDNDLPATPQVQSLYAFFDNFVNSGVVATRTNLVAQTITGEVPGAIATRNISTNPVFYYGASARRGWYVDLKLATAANGIGERFIATPLIQSGRVFFTTYTPLKGSCDPGGVNFQYGLDLLAGTGSLGNVKLQTTGTVACTGSACGAAAITGSNGANISAPVTGSGVAAINPSLFVDPACNVTPMPASCAGGPKFEECQVVIYPGAFVLPRPCGRQSWRQLK